MKKVLSFLVMSFVCLLPLVAKADTSIDFKCSDPDASGIITCSVSGKITGTGVDSLTVTLKEQGGADVTQIMNSSNTDWTVNSRTENNGVWTLLLTTPNVATREANLFTFKYKASGETDCKVVIGLGNTEVPVTPPTAESPADPDKTTENKQTGSTLPYIALGCVAVAAVGAYMATRNKAKMYRL